MPVNVLRWARCGLLSAFIVQSLFFTATQASESQQTGRELVLLNWSEYIDPELLAKFEAQYNVKVREVYFEGDDLRDDMLLETDGEGYDLVLVNGVTVETYQQRGWLAKIDEARVPNLVHLAPRWRDAFPGSRDYAVPYFWGTLGIAYRSDLVKQPPQSWMDLFRPDESLRGKIAMIESSRDAVGMALKALGHSANSEDRQQIMAAGELLEAQKPYIRSYVYLSLTEESALVSGDVAMAMMFSGDALMVSEYNDNIEYIVPGEGGNIWCDYLSVMESSRNKDLAFAFINFLNEPENAAQLAEYVYYATPHLAAEKLLPDDFLSDPIIYPDAETLQRSEFYRSLSPRAHRWRNSAFPGISP